MRRQTAWKLARMAIVAIPLAIVFTALTPHTAPGSAGLPLYNSDQAISVLMANDVGRGLFSAFYYGQDRFGAWPMAIQRLLHHTLGIDWTLESTYLFLRAWLLLGLFALAALHRFAGPLLAAGTILALSLHPVVRAQLSDLQPYAYQATGLAFTWWAIRRALEAQSHSARGKWSGGVFVAASLTIWVSTASAPILFGVLGVELLRVPAGLRRRIALGWPPLIGLIGGVVVEAILRGQFHRAARDAFGHTYTTSIKFDSGHLLENAARMSVVCWHGVTPWVAIGAGIALVGGLFALLRRPTWLDEPPRELLIAAFVLVTGGLVNFALTIVVNHVRLNGYPDRYLAITHLWWVTGAIAAASAVGLILASRVSSRLAVPVTFTAVAVVLGSAVVFAARSEPAPRIAEHRAVVQELLSAPGPHVLLGGYWRVYALAGLGPPGSLIPVAADGDYDRTPFTRSELAAVRNVWVVHEPEEADAPPRWRSDYARLLELETPRRIDRGEHRLSVYRRVPSERLPLAQEDLCADSGGVRIPSGLNAGAVLLELQGSAPAVVGTASITSVEADRSWLKLTIAEGSRGDLWLVPGAVPRAGSRAELDAREAADSIRTAGGSTEVVPRDDAAAGTESFPREIAPATAREPCRVKAAWLVHRAE